MVADSDGVVSEWKDTSWVVVVSALHPLRNSTCVKKDETAIVTLL
jgi:hypothetical protein